MPGTSISGGSALYLPWLPSDGSLLAVDYDPVLAGFDATLVVGVPYYCRVQIRTPITATNLWISVQTAGVGASSGSYLGLYNSSGVQLGVTADIGGSLLATGLVTAPLTTPVELPGGTFVWIGILTNLATTQPTLRACSGPGGQNMNAGMVLPQLRFFSYQSGQTALPASFPPGSVNAGGGDSWWVGIN
jgi:hypothetical protein